jgi:hypothetical protein
MQDSDCSLDQSLTGLKPDAWKEQLLKQADEHGMWQDLGARHFATFIDRQSTLLVTFETIQGIHALSETAQPMGFDLVKAQDWSHLCIVSDGDTWFRDPQVYALFDRLIDEGFFEDFDKVVFYGAGPCGYAAAAFSVAAPGATVVAVQPQATLDPRMTEWDERFVEMRRVSFTDRYGYAPDMLDAADRAFVLYDPREQLDAMHASLFERANVDRLRLRFMGAALQTQLISMDLLYQILSLAGADKLTPRTFYKLLRNRRSHRPYLKSLMAYLDTEDRPYLNMLLCRNVVARMRAPNFRTKLRTLNAQAKEGAFRAPPPAAE